MSAVGWSRVIEGLHAALDEVEGLDAVFLPADATGELLLGLTGVQGRLDALRLRLLAAGNVLAEQDGSRDVAAWLAHRTNSEYAPLRGDLRLAQRLADMPILAAGLGDGKVRLEQAQVIAAAVEALPADVEAQVRTEAEAWLVDAAARHTPRELREFGRKILDVIAPEIAEAQEARRLAAEETAATAATRLMLKDLPDGTTRISGVVSKLAGHRLRTYLEALSSPRIMPGAGPRSRRFGAAFCTLLERFDPARLPEHGGTATTVIVTIDHEALTRELAVAGILGEEAITAAEVRRLACNATILPAMLGGKSEVLDLGRGHRLFNSAQHLALRIRDRRCRAEGCTVPGAWCEAHHDNPWATGGRTDLADGSLLCSHHHHCIHDPAYRIERLPNGDIRFHRRE